MTNEIQLKESTSSELIIPDYLNDTLECNITLQTSVMSIPTMSIRGKVFRIVSDNKEGYIIEDVSATGDRVPSSIIDVVVYAQSSPFSRVYYSTSYTGESTVPDCFSLDGVKPDSIAVSPQAEKCRTCPQARKGSRKTRNNYESTACVPQQRIVLAPVKMLHDICLLRLPSTSMFDPSTNNKEWKAWRQYIQYLARNNCKSTAAVVTSIKFDTVEYPKLLFKAKRPITKEELNIVNEISRLPEVLRYVTPSQPTETIDDTDEVVVADSGLAALTALLDE